MTHQFPTQRSAREVLASPCFHRVDALARRTWTDAEADALADKLTSMLKTEAGTMRLRRVQALALYEAAQWGGLMAPIRVGGGKTLISFLMPKMVPNRKPLVLVPASLVEKTQEDFRAARRHWVGARSYWIESYEKLGRVESAKLLENGEPDLIICDEAHRLKNPQAAVTKRVARYVRESRKANRRLAFVFMTGTVIVRSITEFAHLANWALGDGAPTPQEWVQAQAWARALDAQVPDSQRFAGGVLERWIDPDDRRPGLAPLRAGYRRRMTSTPGVIATQEPPLDVPLTITSRLTEDCEELEEAFRTLRTTGETPDGYPCADAIEVYRHARELASGFYYRANPRPPADWLAARGAWAAACRHVLAHNRSGLDSESAVKIAIRKGQHREHAEALRAWDEIADSYDLEKNRETVWISDKPVQQILEWARDGEPCIIWVTSDALGARLAEYGLPWYGQGAVTALGRPIMRSSPKDGPIVASVLPCSTGQNLQERGWCRNLVAELPSHGGQWEQMIGRTHRDGQTRPVTVEILLGCREDVTTWHKSGDDSACAEELTGQAQKLVHALSDGVHDWDDIAGLRGWRWQRTRSGAVPLRMFGGRFDREEG